MSRVVYKGIVKIFKSAEDQSRVTNTDIVGKIMEVELTANSPEELRMKLGEIIRITFPE